VAFIDKEAIMERLGAAASKPASFAAATGASFFVAACSCTVIPVSSGIYYSGAGIGAAFILLWVAPASNLLSLIYTGNILQSVESGTLPGIAGYVWLRFDLSKVWFLAHPRLRGHRLTRCSPAAVGA